MASDKGELLMASVYKDLLKRRIEAAQGIIPCDLVLKN